MKILYFLLSGVIPATAFANINMAILDTGFCLDKIQSKKNIQIEKVIDLTNSVKENYCKNFQSNLPRFHGHLVLQSFINLIDAPTEQIIITPIIIFDHKGRQTKKYWQQALAKKYDVVLSAAGLVTETKISDGLRGEWFVAAPHLGPGIKDNSAVFPVSLAPLHNLFVIGDFLDGDTKLLDQGQLYKDKIDYFFSSGTGDLRGTSRAVTEATARAINLCANQLKKNLRECLKKKTFDVSGMKSF